MACGKAIVASSVGWGKEVAEDNVSGYLVHPSDTKKYAACILELLEDREKAAMLGKNARKRVAENFTTEIVAKKSLEVYSKVVQ